MRKYLAPSIAALICAVLFAQYVEPQVPARSTPTTCVRDDATATVAQAEGQQTPCKTNSRGALWVDLETRLDATNDAVNIGAINGVTPLMGNGVTGTGSQRVTIASDNTAFSVNANAGTNLNTSALLTTTAHDAAFGTAGTADTQVRSVQGIASMVPLLVNPGTAANYGIYVEDAAETAGGNLVMGGTVRRDAPVSSAGATGDNATLNSSAEGGLWVSQVASVSGGSTPYRLLSAASTNATNIKASAGKVLGIQASNINAAVAYVIFYNTASAPTCTSVGTTTPTYAIPGNTSGGGTNTAFTVGIDFATGIGVCLVTNPAGTGAVAANEVILNVQYK